MDWLILIAQMVVLTGFYFFDKKISFQIAILRSDVESAKAALEIMQQKLDAQAHKLDALAAQHPAANLEAENSSLSGMMLMR